MGGVLIAGVAKNVILDEMARYATATLAERLE